jgi:RNA polymerase sigma factor (sigma-70 family)
MDVTRYTKQVETAVNKAARGASPDRKQDLKQDCFVALLEAYDYLARVAEEGEKMAGGAAYTIAYNRAIEILRTRPVLDAAVSINDLPYEDVGSNAFLESLFSGGITERDLDDAVKMLPKTEQFIIRSVFFKNVPEKELAASVGKSKRWVRDTKDNAITMLRLHFEKR